MQKLLLLLAVLVGCTMAAHAQCTTCGNDPSTGGLICNDTAVGGCKCSIHYLGRGLWSCTQCGFCTFGCTISCNPGYCDPSDPNCPPAPTPIKTASLIANRVALQSPKMAGVLTAISLSKNGCQLMKGKLRDENTKTQDSWVMFKVSNGWIIQMGSETLGVQADHWFLTRRDLPVITERIIQ